MRAMGVLSYEADMLNFSCDPADLSGSAGLQGRRTTGSRRVQSAACIGLQKSLSRDVKCWSAESLTVHCARSSLQVCSQRICIRYRTEEEAEWFSSTRP